MALETVSPSVPAEQSANAPHSFLLAKRALLPNSQVGTVRHRLLRRGQWRDVKGEVWMVEACERHPPDAENEPPLTPAA